MAKATGARGGMGNGRHETARARTDDANAFLPDPENGRSLTDDDLAETLAEDYLRAATSGDDVDNEVLDQIVPEEIGGPFVETAASDEYAMGSDASNPDDAEVEPLPRAVHGLAETPRE
jgi:hypothetical protein